MSPEGNSVELLDNKRGRDSDSEQLSVAALGLWAADEVKLMQPWQKQLPASFFHHSCRTRKLSELHMQTPTHQIRDLL